jgi:hypothetical protein
MPEGATRQHRSGTSWREGSSGTMALFIASLACGAGTLLDAATVGIRAASLVVAPAVALHADEARRAQPAA